MEKRLFIFLVLVSYRLSIPSSKNVIISGDFKRHMNALIKLIVNNCFCKCKYIYGGIHHVIQRTCFLSQKLPLLCMLVILFLLFNLLNTCFCNWQFLPTIIVSFSFEACSSSLFYPKKFVFLYIWLLSRNLRSENVSSSAIAKFYQRCIKMTAWSAFLSF